MSLAIGMTTSPRPTSTVEVSLVSLRGAGWSGDVMVSSNNGPVSDVSTLVQQPFPLAHCQHWLYVLQWLYTETSADWLMVAQDDVLWLQTARGVLQGDLLGAEALPDVGLLSLHAFGSTQQAITQVTGGMEAPGWYAVPPEAKLSGAQVLLLPRTMAGQLLTDRTFVDLLGTQERHLDHHVHDAVNRLGKRTYLLHPRTVSHELGGIHSNRSHRMRFQVRSHRDVMAGLADRFGWKWGAELGMGHGHLSRRLLETVPDLTLIGVDTMRVPERKAAVSEIARAFASRTMFYESTTADAAAHVKDGILDFVFVDASHHYRNVEEDIRLWRPKLRPGGWFGGHDYSPRFPGVIQAVREHFGREVDLLPYDIWVARRP